MLKNQIQKYRLAAKLNKAQLARLVGVSDVAVSYWESGAISGVTSNNLLSLSAALNVTVSELLNDPLLPDYNAKIAKAAVEAVQIDVEVGNN